ncbi:cell division protein ZapE [Erythrobacter sp. KY5]|uniref:cell division protein ZapE n=1 Tax=Erythrobacter sp. KY5 TaxID=2011159 RepID=UPI000DBF08C6|nr:cell division protein ZapE [Erythrobacter sp. KY5]AWW74890.1 cell division protein ZapE [Erythrobacter sp. KY5]
MTRMRARYEQLIANGELREDPDQRRAVERLNALQKELEAEKPGGLLAQLFARKQARPQGVYMWGGVGRGKSMLMDLFHDTLAIPEKRRAHFHAFMQEVHEEMRLARQNHEGDPIPPVAAKLSEGLRVLAFDEMVVNNSADAMIMSRLFTQLIREQDVCIVTTSNRPPADLYKDGLNREHFLPFIDLISEELDVVGLNGPTDYRLDRIGDMATWHSPFSEEATAKVREVFFRLTDFDPQDAANVPTGVLDISSKRDMHVPKALKGVAAISFKRLCGEARGASDYLALARAFHTIILVGIPKMGPDQRNEAARFVTLIDALYEHRVKLFVTAEARPEELYTAGDGSFEFERTVSRLNEMQSDEYMALGHGAEN